MIKSGRHFVWKDSIYEVKNELEAAGSKLEEGDCIFLNNGDSFYYNGKSFVHISNLQALEMELSWKDL